MSDSSNGNAHDAFDDLEDWLADQDGSGAPLWDPQPGDTLTGVFLRYETRYSQKIGGQCKIAIIEDRGEDLHAVWLSRSVLASEYERQNPQAGDLVAPKYHGLQEPRGQGKAYHNYTVRVQPARAVTAPTAPPPAATPSTPSQSRTAVVEAAPPQQAQGTQSDDDIPF